MIGRIIRLPLKLIAMPAALALFLCHAACAIVIGIGSMVTNLVSGLFIFGAAIEWIAGAPSSMAYQCLGLGLFLLAAPHFAGWIAGKAADLLVFDEDIQIRHISVGGRIEFSELAGN